jgi:hypothetical protein
MYRRENPTRTRVGARNDTEMDGTTDLRRGREASARLARPPAILAVLRPSPQPRADAGSL